MPDDDRPLTSKGRKKFRAAAAGLARIAQRPDVLLTSPLPRARATAEIIARAFGRIEPIVEPVLAQGRVDAIVAAMQRYPLDASVVVVGHEPALSALLAHLLETPHGERLAFKKGGTAFLDLPEGPGAGGRLVWFLKPRILRALAGD